MKFFPVSFITTSTYSVRSIGDSMMFDSAIVSYLQISNYLKITLGIC